MSNLKGLAAADVGAGQFVVASYHVRLRFGEAGAVTLVGPARHLRPLAPHDPCYFVLARLSALGADEVVRPLFRGFIEKIALFHCFQALQLAPGSEYPLPRIAAPFRSGRIYSILILAMRKRKPGIFSATKAVKANARERVGQPKPARVVDTEPRTGREAKHKPSLEETIRQEE